MSRHIGKTHASRSYNKQLHQAISAQLPRNLRLIPENKKERWTPRYLVITALLMACLGVDLLTDRFHAARAALIKMYPTRRRPGKCAHGFAKALGRLGAKVIKSLLNHLRRQTQRLAGPNWRIGRWVVFGCDGSRFDKTRTKANRQRFGIGGKGKTCPQQFLTTLFHVGTGLPWDWRAGNADAWERHLLREMLGGLPPGALLLIDAGYVGYALLKQIIASRKSFIVRVGAGVELLEGLGWCWRERKGIVSLWPKHAQEHDCPPLTLRLVSVIDGKGRRMHLLTSVLDRALLSDAQVRRMYKLRWGVEVLFRTIKQTMDLRKALAWTPQAAAQELEWAMMGVKMLGLMALEAQPRPAGAGGKPHPWSAAGTLRVIRRAIRGSMGRGPSLARLLRQAVRDGYVRKGSKKATDWAHKKREKPPGNPRVRAATAAEILAAAALRMAA